MKKNAKYSYVTGTRATDHGSRTYDIAGEKLPSVTTILGKTHPPEKAKKLPGYRPGYGTTAKGSLS